MMNTRVGIHMQAREATLPKIHEIEVAMLEDPGAHGQHEEHYLGRGSFGVVKLQLYRGVHVAVKEFCSRTIKEDVKKEAGVLASLCHHIFLTSLGFVLLPNPSTLLCNFMVF